MKVALSTGDMSTASGLRIELAATYKQLKNGDIKHTDAAELANLAGKMINSAKIQVEYYALRKEAPTISFLSDDVGTKTSAFPNFNPPK